MIPQLRDTRLGRAWRNHLPKDAHKVIHATWCKTLGRVGYRAGVATMGTGGGPPPAQIMVAVTVLPATTHPNLPVLVSGTGSGGSLGLPLFASSWFIDFGDGFKETLVGAPGQTSVSDFHSYTTAGVFTVLITATDSAGNKGVGTMAVTVTPNVLPPQTIQVSGSKTVSTLTFNFTGVTPFATAQITVLDTINANVRNASQVVGGSGAGTNTIPWFATIFGIPDTALVTVKDMTSGVVGGASI